VARILVITTSYPSLDDDAAGHFVRSEVDRAIANGHEVTVLAPRAARDAELARVIGLPHFGAFGSPGALSRLRARPDRWVGAFLFVMTARSASHNLGPFDRTLAHFILPSFWPICANTRGEVEVVVHGSDLRLLERLPRALRKYVLRTKPGIKRSFRCVSHELAERLAKLFEPSEEPAIRVEPCPVMVAQLPSKAELREKLGVYSAKLVVIVTRLVASKRVDVALHAASATPANVVVCGDGPERRQLEHAFPRVHFCGQVPRRSALEWMAASDVVLSASRQEGAPTVVREARALGVPVVATEAGDLARWAACDPGIFVVKLRPAEGQKGRVQEQELNQYQEQELTQVLLQVLYQ
jgi:teichuronic acid biosynthesis glycosyltransferase TuaC